MAENITLVSLRRALSAQTKVSEKVADEFLRALIETISEGLNADKEVTVSGLGTFKLQEVAPRESVNIATGERFEIAGYNKVAFIADTRAPKAAEMPTPAQTKKRKKKEVEEIDPIQKLGEQAEEIKGILGELGAMGGEIIASTEGAEKTEIEGESASTESTEKTETEGVSAPTDGKDAASTDSTDQTNVQAEEKKEKKPFNPWLTTLITLIVFTLLLVAAYFFLRYKIIHWTDNMRQTIEQRVTPKEAEETILSTDATEQTEEQNGTNLTNPTNAGETEMSTETTEQTETTNSADSDKSALENKSTKAINYFDDNERTFTEFKATETVGRDSRLAWVAYKYYGNKAYWVFVYEANKDKLESPDFVLPGMELKIPAMPKELKNPNDPKTAELLERLSKKYLATF